LERIGYRVLPAADCTEALVWWDGNREEIDLVLSDMVIPGRLTGLALAEQLRKIKPGLKIIITSGYSQDDPIFMGNLPQGITYIPKPHQIGPLSMTIRKCLEEKE
jgi:DNA-binding NtrC family response regulator